MTASFSHAPKRANRFTDGQWHQVSLGGVQAGNRSLVRHDEVMLVDGTLSGPADLDEPMLTGEPLTRHRLMADAICSGVLNVDAAFEMTASMSAERSTSAGVAQLVSAVQSECNPSVGLVDRYVFTLGGVATLLAGISWILTGDSARCFAVFVVVTPRPLILVVPVAIASELSRCIKRGVLVKGGGVLKRLTLTSTLFFDKTDTPISGFARLVDVECAPHYASDVVLGLAGSTVQASNRVTAETAAKATREQGARLRLPSRVVESPGTGVCGHVDGHIVSIGSLPYTLDSSVEPSWVEVFARRVNYAGISVVPVGINGELVGILQLIGRVRLEVPRAFRFLCREGIKRQTMLAGDQADVAESAGSILGVTEVYAILPPAAKPAVIWGVRIDGKVIMVGDGVNGAPALATADTDVTMDTRGAAVFSGIAGIVLLVDRLDRLVDAVRIVYRTRSVALRNVVIGMSLSLAAMVVAALGHLPPLVGAVLQELIDMLAITSALRALLPTPDKATRSLVYADVKRLEAEHAELEPILSQIHSVVDALPHTGSSAAKDALLSLNQSLADIPIPHEHRDSTQLYPDAARLFDGDDPMMAMSATHRGVFRMANLLGRIVVDISADGSNATVTQGLQRLLYGLDAIPWLHCAQEDELLHMLGGEA